MGNTNYKIEKSRVAMTSTSKETEKIISGKNISDRTFETRPKNDNSSINKMINRFYAERELSGYYMYCITNTNSHK